MGLPKDIFLFMSLNRNQPRKRLDILIMSFVELITKHPLKPIFMLISSDKGERGGHQLFDIFARELKLKNVPIEHYGNRLMITSKDVGYKDEDINLFYNVADVGVSCAEGEGFGLCSFEQMAVGVPQIVPNINGYNEYCNNTNSLIINPSYRYYIPLAHNMVTGEAQVVDHMKVAEAMERYVLDEGLRKEHGQKAKETVKMYTWENSVKSFVKRLLVCYEEDDN
jgi:glycosyltransferase involved in cell wall biosynthesis